MKTRISETTPGRSSLTGYFPISPHYVDNAPSGPKERPNCGLWAYAVDCDQAFVLCCLFCVRLDQFARPETRLAAIARPHPTADSARNYTERAYRDAAQHRNDARTGRDRQRLAPHDDCLFAEGKEYGRCRSRVSWRGLLRPGHRSRRHGGVRVADLKRDHLCAIKVSCSELGDARGGAGWAASGQTESPDGTRRCAEDRGSSALPCGGAPY